MKQWSRAVNIKQEKDREHFTTSDERFNQWSQTFTWFWISRHIVLFNESKYDNQSIIVLIYYCSILKIGCNITIVWFYQAMLVHLYLFWNYSFFIVFHKAKHLINLCNKHYYFLMWEIEFLLKRIHVY